MCPFQRVKLLEKYGKMQAFKNQNSLWRNLQNWKVFLVFLSWIKGYLKWIKGRTKHYTKKLNFSSGRVDEINLGVMTSDRHIMEREDSVND